MKYDLAKPCAGCPFSRAKTAVRLTEGRVDEIIDAASTRGREFACHKTVDYDGDDAYDNDNEDERAIVVDPAQKHCAGALIFMLKHGGLHQMGRIVERLGMFDASKLEPHFDMVFDDDEEMRATALVSLRRRKSAR